MSGANSTQTGGRKPLVREIHLGADALVPALLSLDAGRRLSLLDSCGSRGAAARLLIAGFDPFEVIEIKDGCARISSRVDDSIRHIKADALELLDERLALYASEFSGSKLHTGACIATLSYDLVHTLERLRSNPQRERTGTEPDAVFAFYDTLVIHDYAQGKTVIAGSGERRRVDEIEAALHDARLKAEAEKAHASVAASNLTRAEYLAAVRRVKEHIAAGDIYQANLTQQFTCTLPEELGAEDVFQRLRHDHPAPFASFIRRRGDTVVSISPERFVRVEPEKSARRIEAWPIKGTRPRGLEPPEDARLRVELQASEKDRAENVMIVDLLRNDLGRVCHYGSVEVTELCAIEEHPTLFHLVSKVRGTLRDKVTAGDILRACFPCGSITGAPKIRAMEVIDEVETAPRGLSMGAIGYFAFDGSLDLSVAIRTMTVTDRLARFNVGGGIVADSDPEKEYEESLVKARALFRALGVKT